MNAQRPLLILGFDGLLHPFGCASSRYLERMPILEQWLNERPAVDVVISSGWMKLAPNRLAARLSAELYERVIGMAIPNRSTAKRREDAGEAHADGAAARPKGLPFTDGNVLGQGAREFDIWIWRHGWCWRGQPWRVLEARGGQSDVQCLEMITVDAKTGVTAQTLVELDAWLDEMGGVS